MPFVARIFCYPTRARPLPPFQSSIRRHKKIKRKRQEFTSRFRHFVIFFLLERFEAIRRIFQLIFLPLLFIELPSIYSMSAIILSEVTAFIAALLFAVHPIHTEAVSRKLLINSQFFTNCASHSTARKKLFSNVGRRRASSRPIQFLM